MLKSSVTIVAPDQNRSGASNSLTLDAPIRIREMEPQVFSVSGTPTDCVHIALTGLLDEDPDMVVSGINHGANLGTDLIYSGTAAGAREGTLMGVPAVAFSYASYRSDLDFDAAGAIAADICPAIKSKFKRSTKCWGSSANNFSVEKSNLTRPTSQSALKF